MSWFGDIQHIGSSLKSTLIEVFDENPDDVNTVVAEKGSSDRLKKGDVCEIKSGDVKHTRILCSQLMENLMSSNSVSADSSDVQLFTALAHKLQDMSDVTKAIPFHDEMRNSAIVNLIRLKERQHALSFQLYNQYNQLEHIENAMDRDPNTNQDSNAKKVCKKLKKLLDEKCDLERCVDALEDHAFFKSANTSIQNNSTCEADSDDKNAIQMSIVNELESRIQELESEVESLRLTKKSSTETEDNLTNGDEELERMRCERDQMLNVLNEKSRDFNRVKTENISLSSLLDEERSKTDQVQQQMDELIEVNKQTVIKLSKMISDRDAQINELTQQLSNVDETNQKEADVDGGEGEAVVSDKLEKKVKKYKEKFDKVSSEANELKIQNEHLKAEIIEIKSKSEATTENEDERKQAIEDLQNRVNELNSSKSEVIRQSTELRRELSHVVEKRKCLQAELDRLRAHLIEMEERYTAEMVNSKGVEEELAEKLEESEKSLRESNAHYTSSSGHVQRKLETLESSLKEITSQRDNFESQINTMKTELNSKSEALNNLSAVLEGSERDKENCILWTKREYEQKLSVEYKQRTEIEGELESIKEELDSFRENQESTSRLTSQLQVHANTIQRLKREMDEKDESCLKLKRDLTRLKSQFENDEKVDIVLMKNLMLGYIRTDTPSKKVDALRIISSLLKFDDSDKQNAGLCSRLPSFDNGQGDNSIAEAFVKFLESESTNSDSAHQTKSDDVRQSQMYKMASDYLRQEEESLSNPNPSSPQKIHHKP